MTTVDIGAGIGSTAVVIGLIIVFIYILKRYRLRKPGMNIHRSK
jgi:flagellar biogenesis protein FliO